MTQRTCIIDGCNGAYRAREMCARHYDQWQRREGSGRPRCSINECRNPALKRGWCDMHYQRWRIHGDPSKVIVRTRSICGFPECGRYVAAHGLCETHNRQRSDGQPLTKIRGWRLQNERDECGRKLCRRCNKWLSESSFCKSSRNSDGLSYMCRPCGTDTHRVANYGLTWDRYQQMLAEQGGGCAICGEQCASGRMLAVDHDHSCCSDNSRSCGDCIRGLLCGNCNQGIGKLGDSPARLRSAAAYLDRYRE